MKRPFTLPTLRSKTERTFDPSSAPPAEVDWLRRTVANGHRPLRRLGYSIAVHICIGEGGEIVGAHAKLLCADDRREVAFLSISIDSERAQALWEQHIEVHVAMSKSVVVGLDERFPPASPWLLVSPLESTIEENDWLDDFTRSWAAAFKFVATDRAVIRRTQTE